MFAFVLDGVGRVPVWGRSGGRTVVRAWAQVDPADIPVVTRYRWHLKDGYARAYHGGRPPRRRTEWMHRLLLGLRAGDPRIGDHMDRQTLNNRRANLRVLDSEAQSKQNVGANRGGSSVYRGVSWEPKRGCWRAQATCGGERLHRYCGTEEEARDVAMAWRAEHMPHATD